MLKLSTPTLQPRLSGGWCDFIGPLSIACLPTCCCVLVVCSVAKCCRVGMRWHAFKQVRYRRAMGINNKYLCCSFQHPPFTRSFSRFVLLSMMLYDKKSPGIRTSAEGVGCCSTASRLRRAPPHRRAGAWVVCRSLAVAWLSAWDGTSAAHSRGRPPAELSP